MSMEHVEFIHPSHLTFFIEAAEIFNCHILVRKTGSATIHWIGKRGYTGKRADMKAKTANLNVGPYLTAGLVCSPLLRPEAFTANRLGEARKEWLKSCHLITEPPHGFDDDRQPIGCHTSYMLQTDPQHRHYGCVALVEMGLLIPRYVHGDYDLYMLIPANQPFNPNKISVRQSSLVSTMSPSSLSMNEQARMPAMNVQHNHDSLPPSLILPGQARISVPNYEGPLSFQVANYINVCIANTGPDLLGALMVNHGEQSNIGEKGLTYEPVLAIMPKPRQGQYFCILATRDAHEEFYRNA